MGERDGEQLSFARAGGERTVEDELHRRVERCRERDVEHAPVVVDVQVDDRALPEPVDVDGDELVGGVRRHGEDNGPFGEQLVEIVRAHRARQEHAASSRLDHRLRRVCVQPLEGRGRNADVGRARGVEQAGAEDLHGAGE